MPFFASAYMSIRLIDARLSVAACVLLLASSVLTLLADHLYITQTHTHNRRSMKKPPVRSRLYAALDYACISAAALTVLMEKSQVKWGVWVSLSARVYVFV